ncbi:MAG: PH domain-containing protein [Opitutaceae bacterium]|nr:PH domain-containing protein [Opitutaceae bacterium]
MVERIRSFVLRILRVPPEPTPPLGAPGSVRVFRAGANFYRLRLAEWTLAQLGAAFGIAFSVVFLLAVQNEIEHARAQPAHRANTPAPAPAFGTNPPPAATHPASRSERALSPFRQAVAVAAGLPPWVLLVADILKIAGVLFFLGQIPFSYTVVRLEYEQHWYIVTDRSLRIRHGLISMIESTMSFANVQQVVVHQGPLQRLLGIADVRVQSAGGAGEQHDGKKHGESLHTGIFRGVANATEIRDLILERLRLFRETGLGDSDEPRAAPSPCSVEPPTSTAALAAAREILTETRALRAALE